MTAHTCPDCGSLCECAPGQSGDYLCEHCNEIDPDDLPEETIADEE